MISAGDERVFVPGNTAQPFPHLEPTELSLVGYDVC